MTLTETIKKHEDEFFNPDIEKQKFVPVASGAGTYELIPAVVGKQIQILSFKFAINTGGSYTLQSATDDLFVFPMSSSGGIFRDSGSPERPLFCGSIGENINIVTTANPTAGGVYVQWIET